MKKFMRILLILTLVIGGGLFSYNKYENHQQKIAMEKTMKLLESKRLDPVSIKEDYEKKIEMDRKIAEKQKEIAEFMRSDEYRERAYIRDLKEAHGIEADDYIIMDVQLSYYSDLNCENGYGNITATGEVLSPGMVANNKLSFGTKIYMEGHGIKTVKDRGSEKYFGTMNKFDVFVPRNGGESDSDYYKRVNSMGRDVVKAVIFI